MCCKDAVTLAKFCSKKGQLSIVNSVALWYMKEINIFFLKLCYVFTLRLRLKCVLHILLHLRYFLLSYFLFLRYLPS